VKESAREDLSNFYELSDEVGRCTTLNNYCTLWISVNA
jgi:hypothetical protein